MKIINLKKKNIVIFVFCLVFTVGIMLYNTSFGMQYYYNVDFSTGLVTASNLNVRSGPGLNYKIITTVNKDSYIRVFAGIGNWYVVQTDGDYVGVVSKKYIKPIYSKTSSTNNTTANEVSSQMSQDEKEVFDLINKQRTNNGLANLKMDEEVLKVARIKAQDMVNNNYFDHNSPIYGSPFNMLNNFKISYKSAGENIAGNSSNSGAVNAWMNSPGHKANILNTSFNYTGIGVVKSSRYGKIYVQMFIQK